MSGKKKKLQEKEAEEQKESTVKDTEIVQTDNFIQEKAETSSVEEQPSIDRYAQLETQLCTLRAESEKMQEELQKIRERRGDLNRRFYRELLDSEVLGQAAACYVESQGKKELYENVRQFLEEHAEERDGIRAELRASRERNRSSGVSSLACAAGILSVAGIIYAAAGMAPGAVIVLFLVLIVLSGYIWVNAEKTARINGCAEYLLTVIEDIENSKKIPN